MTLPTTLTWNCRGASSRAFLRHLRDLLTVHKPDILILLETRCVTDVVQEIFKFSALTDSIVSEAHGFAGGIWILWNRDKLHLEPLAVHDQIVSVLVRSVVCLIWVLSAIYASPNPFFREELWQYILQLGPLITLPWLLLGDFNQVLSGSEKKGGCPVNQRNMAALQAVVTGCSLVDMGFSGPRFTWSNMRLGSAAIRERLDRGF